MRDAGRIATLRTQLIKAAALAATQPVPVHVWQSDNGVCFYAFSWQTNCVPTDLIR